MFLYIHHLVNSIKLRMLGKRCKVKDPDMVCGSDIKVVFPLFEIVENPAQVGKGAVVPEALCPDLQFDIDDNVAVEQHLDV